MTRKIFISLAMAFLLTVVALCFNSCFGCNHKYTETVIKQPTCQENGVVKKNCMYCRDEKEEVKYSSDLYHQYENVKVIKNPTCTEYGEKTGICKYCSRKTTESISPLGHSNEILASEIEATCYQDGSTAYIVCSRCNIVVNESVVIPKKEHSYKDEFCEWCHSQKTYTISFIFNNETIHTDDTYVLGEQINYPDDKVTLNEGTSLVGWFDADGNKYTSNSAVNGNITLYAKVERVFVISALGDLKNIASNPGGNYILKNDINCNGEIWKPIDKFTGTFDGNGYSIYNIILSTTEKNNYGFFRVNEGTVKNVVFEDFTFNATVTPKDMQSYGVVVGENMGEVSSVTLERGVILFNSSYKSTGGYHEVYSSFGGIVGRSQNGSTIDNCVNKVNIDVNILTENLEYSDFSKTRNDLYHYVGGVVGRCISSVSNSAYTGKINCSVVANGSIYIWGISGEHEAFNRVFAGAIAGELSDGGKCDRCYTSAEVNVQAKASSYHNGNYTTGYTMAKNYVYTGGLVGKAYKQASVNQSYATGTVFGNGNGDCAVGGLVGLLETDCSAKSSYAMSDVVSEGKASIGGFVGANKGIVQDSYASGSVTSRGNGNAGGFAGFIETSGSVSKCYSTGDVTANNGTIGHFVGKSVGAISKCYFIESSAVLLNGEYVTNGTEYDSIEGVAYSTLWSEEFLINNLYWENYGWTIIVDENPILSWEKNNGHSFETTTVPPFCEVGGFTIYKCKDCSKLFVDDYVSPIGHDEEIRLDIKATCSEEGYVLVGCRRENCFYLEKTNVTEKTPHNENNITVKSTVAATCLEGGMTVYHCNDCNSDFMVELDPLGHIGVYTRTEKTASCGEEGIDIYECVRDCCSANREYEVLIEKLPHTEKNVEYLAPSCAPQLDEAGEIIGYDSRDGHYPGIVCEVCNETISGLDIIPAHSLSLKKTVVKASCTTDGQGEFECADCGYSMVRALEKTGHTDGDYNGVCESCKSLTFTSLPESLFVHIKTVDDLMGISKNLSGYYILDNDLDLTDVNWKPIGTSERPFEGVFYGAGYKIKNLYVKYEDKDGENAFGLFGCSKGTIVGVVLNGWGADVKNTNCVFGGIVAENRGSVICCTLEGESTFNLKLELDVGDYKYHSAENSIVGGGLVGVNSPTGVVDKCISKAKVSVKVDSITRISSSSNIVDAIIKLIKETKADTKHNITFGTIAGRNEGKVMESRCPENTDFDIGFEAELKHRRGNIKADTNMYLAGMVGYNSGSILNCYVGDVKYGYHEGYSFKNMLDCLMQSALYKIEVNFVNHTEMNKEYFGFVGDNSGSIEIEK